MIEVTMQVPQMGERVKQHRTEDRLAGEED